METTENNTQEVAPDETAEQMQHAIMMMNAGGLGNTPEGKELTEAVQKASAANQNTTTQNEVKPVAETKEEEKVEVKEEEKPVAETDNNDPWNIGATQNKVEVNSIDDFKNILESKFSISDPSTFFNSVDKWRNDSQSLASTQNQLESISNDLANLPDPIKDGIDSWAKGEDWQQAINSSKGRLNFDVIFENQPKEDLVNYYFNGAIKDLSARRGRDVEDGGISEEQYKDRVNSFYKSSKELFTKEKRLYDQQRVDRQTQQDQKLINLKQTAMDSVASFEKQFPNFKSSEIQRIRQVLVNGNLNSYFFDKNGNWLPDAAKRIAFMETGDDLLDRARKSGVKQGESKANEEKVINGNERPPGTTNQGGEQVMQKDQLNAVQHLVGLTSKDPFVGNGVS